MKLSTLEKRILNKCKNSPQQIENLLIDLLVQNNKPYYNGIINIGFLEKSKVITMGFEKKKLEDTSFLSRNATALYRLLTAINRLKSQKVITFIASNKNGVANLENCTNKENIAKFPTFSEQDILYIPICLAPELVELVRKYANSNITITKKGVEELNLLKTFNNVRKHRVLEMKHTERIA